MVSMGKIETCLGRFKESRTDNVMQEVNTHILTPLAHPCKKQAITCECDYYQSHLS